MYKTEKITYETLKNIEEGLNRTIKPHLEYCMSSSFFEANTRTVDFEIQLPSEEELKNNNSNLHVKLFLHTNDYCSFNKNPDSNECYFCEETNSLTKFGFYKIKEYFESKPKNYNFNDLKYYNFIEITNILVANENAQTPVHPLKLDDEYITKEIKYTIVFDLDLTNLTKTALVIDEASLLVSCLMTKYW